RLADGHHRHRAVAAAGDHAPPLERIEREIGIGAARADRLARRELLALAPGADHDVAAHRELLERDAHCRGRVVLGGLLVGTPEPSRARERRALGYARVALAEAETALLARRFGDAPLLGGVRHDPTESGPAAASTSSINSPIASSMLPFSITGTACLRARPR